jgi:outer membrane receptor protein involved in Fe transport
MLGGLALSLAGARADADEARYRLVIPQKPYADALIDLGVQANVSIIGTSICGPNGRAALTGAYTLDEALAHILAGAPCDYRILDPRTVRIVAPPPAAKAEAAPVRTPTLVAEILVTAAKRPSSVGRLPASVSVIPHDQIELTGAADVEQTTAQMAGVLTTNLGPARDKLILRDLSDGSFTGRTRSTVGSYLDDAAINYNAPDPDLQLVDVERIEVIRGPQGALYGSGSLSGVFRIVTRKPDLTRPAFGVAGLVADTKGGSPSHEIEGYANLPLAHDVAALRLVGYRDVQGGYIDNAQLRLSNVDTTVREGGRVALRLQPHDAWQLDLSAIAQRLRSNDTQYTVSTPEMARLARDERLSRLQERHKNDFMEGSATLRGEFGGWASLRANVAYVDHTFSSQFDASQVLAAVFNDPASLGVYYEHTRIHMLSADIVLRSTRSDRLSWLVGAYAVGTREKSPASLDAQQPSGMLRRFYTENRRDQLHETAIYGEASYAFAPGWTASLGGRFFTSSVHTQSGVIAPVFPGVSRSVAYSTDFDGFSPKVSVQRQFASGAIVYALYSEGYRPGGFNTGGLQLIRPSRLTFAPDKLRNYELGLKGRLFDARLNLRTAVFFDQWRNIQTDQYRPSGIPYTANAGDADITGWESELDYDFDFGLSVQLNALVADSRITRSNPDFLTQVITALPTVPRFSGGLLAVYQHPLPRNLTLRLIGETGYVGSSAISFDAKKTTRMGEYANTRLSAQVAGRDWTATLFVTNPTDAAGDTFSYGNPFTFSADNVRQSTPQRPRTFGIRLTADY